MKKSLGILLGLLLSFGALFAAGDPLYEADSYARLNHVTGDVFVQRAEGLGYEEGVVNLVLIQGDKLGTREGRAEIHLGARNYLRINGNTQVDLAGLPRGDMRIINLHVLSGRVLLRVNELEREKDIEIHTPDASFYLLDAGLYSVEVRENQETVFRSLEGAAEAAGEAGSQVVENQEFLVASEGRFITGPEYDSRNFGDAFDEWSRSRDTFLNRAVARRYLPNELNAYESELDYYGSWVYEQPYGYVWTPRVYHDTWQPYWNGRWSWYPIIGWTWISSEPWGWCVSHYGRWQWSGSHGWYWIPTRSWGPAWVHWYSGSDYYGWCPLSHHGYPGMIFNNRYYGRGNHRFSPMRSRSLVMVHKRQLQARHVSRAALGRTQIGRLGKISLRSGVPNTRPAISRTSSSARTAARVLARSDVRRVRKFEAPGRTSRVTGNKNLRRSGSSKLSRSGSTRIRSYPAGSSNRSTSVRSSRDRSSAASGGRTGGLSSRSARSSASTRGEIRTYPSRNSAGARSVRGRSNVTRAESSTQSIRPYASRSAERAPGRASASRTRPGSSIRERANVSGSRTTRTTRGYSAGGVSTGRSSSSRSTSRARSTSSASGIRSRSSSSSSSRARSRSSLSSSRVPSRSSSRSSASSSRSPSRSSISRSRSTSSQRSSSGVSRSSSRSSTRSRSSSSARSSSSRSRKSGSGRTSSSRSGSRVRKK